MAVAVASKVLHVHSMMKEQTVAGSILSALCNAADSRCRSVTLKALVARLRKPDWIGSEVLAS